MKFHLLEWFHLVKGNMRQIWNSQSLPFFLFVKINHRNIRASIYHRFYLFPSIIILTAEWFIHNFFHKNDQAHCTIYNPCFVLSRCLFLERPDQSCHPPTYWPHTSKGGIECLKKTTKRCLWYMSDTTW